MKPEKSRAAAMRHGHSAEPEFGVWKQMLGRCLNPSHQTFALYGGRGITVCARWQTYENFIADMGQRPSAKHSLDRIDNDGNYESSNCRWTDHRTQMNNTRRNVVIGFEGRRLTVTQWARELGMNPSTLKNRLIRGWPVGRALTQLTQTHAPAGTFDKQAYMRAYRKRAYGTSLVPRETKRKLA